MPIFKFGPKSNGNGVIKLPCVTLTGKQGAVGVIGIPKVRVVGTGTKQEYGIGVIKLPVVNVEGYGYSAVTARNNGSGVLVVPTVAVQGFGLRAQGTGTGIITIPVVSLFGTGSVDTEYAFGNEVDIVLRYSVTRRYI